MLEKSIRSAAIPLFIFCFLFINGVMAQKGTPLSGTRRQEVMREITQNVSNVVSLRCHFVQTRTSPMLSTSVESQGHMSYTRPSTLRWEYESPYRQAIIVRGDSLITSQEGKKSSTSAKAMTRGLVKMMVGSLNGEKLFDERLFTIDVYEEAQDYVAVMKPRRRDMQRLFRTITFTFAKKDSVVKSVTLSEREDTATTIRFDKYSIQQRGGR